jgi:hypothetical protein
MIPTVEQRIAFLKKKKEKNMGRKEYGAVG